MQSLESHRRSLAINAQLIGNAARSTRANRTGLAVAATLLWISAAPMCVGQSAPAPAPAVAPSPSSAAPAQSPAPPSTGSSAAQSSAPSAQTVSPAASAPPSPSPTAAPTASTAASAVPGVDVAHYIIGAEDTLQINVWKEPTISGTIPVRPDGMISLVLVGDLPAAGITPMQLTTDIATRLKKYIQDPIVTVVVTGVNSRRAYFVGEVNKVGPLSLASDMTVLQAISAAGGLSTFAHSKRIYILRGAKGHEQKIFFNYKQALKGDSRQDILLQPGDTVVVP